MPSTTVMLPTYNEKENIQKIITQILEIDHSFHILIVDDDSPDGTANIVKEMSKNNPNIHLLLRKNEIKGRGAAGIAGLSKALEYNTDYIIEMDADFSHDPKYIPRLLEKIKECDVVLGSRLVKGGSETGRTKTRRLTTILANWYIRIILGIKAKDATSGYRCFRRKVLEEIDIPHMKSVGPAIIQEILYKCHLKGFNIKEVPITFYERAAGVSNLKPELVIAGLLTVPKMKILHMLGRF